MNLLKIQLVRGKAGPLAIAFMAMMLALSPQLGAANGLSSKETQAAQKLYTGKCAKCHKLYDPNGYEPERWELWMQKMKKKSKLKPDQFELLSRYIDANLRTETKPDIKPKP